MAKKTKKKKGVRKLLADRYKSLLTTKTVEFIPTGFKPLDIQLGGGFARSQYSLVVGYEGSGKTTLMLQIAREAQKMGLLPIIFDTEFAISEQRMETFGIEVATKDKAEYGSSAAIYIQPDTIETVSAILDDILNWKYKGEMPKDQGILMIWDSITSTPTDVEIEADIGDAQVALASRILAKFIKKHSKYFEPLDVTLIAVCQYREKIQINPFDKKVNSLRLDSGKTIPGGYALKFKAYQLLTLEPTKVFEITSGKPLGRHVKMKTLKNKAINPLLEYEGILTFARGFNNNVDMLAALIKGKYLKKSGKTTYCLKGYKDDEKKNDYLAFMKSRFFKLLKDDEEFKNKCLEYYDEICQKILNPMIQAEELLAGKEVVEEGEEETTLSVQEMIDDISNRE